MIWIAVALGVLVALVLVLVLVLVESARGPMVTDPDWCLGRLDLLERPHRSHSFEAGDEPGQDAPKRPAACESRRRGVVVPLRRAS